MRNKKMFLAVTLLAAMLTVTACGNTSSNSSTSTPTSGADVTVSPTPDNYNSNAATSIKAFSLKDEDLKLVKSLGDYKSYFYEPFDPTVSDEDVNKYVKEMYDNAIEEGAKGYDEDTDSAADRVVKKGDVVNIAFCGYVDDKKFDGGEADSYDLVIGSGSFVDNFEDQLIGYKKGDEVTVNVTFPKEYYEELAGKKARFECKINYFSKEVEVTEENCYKYFFNFESMDKLKEYVKVKLEAQIAANAEDYLESCQNGYIVDVIGRSEFDDISAIADEYAIYYFTTMENIAKGNGSSIDEMIGFLGVSSVDEYKELIKKDAVNTVKQELVLACIAKEEGVELSDEDFKKYGESYLKNTTYESLDEYIKAYDRYYGEGSFRKNIESIHISNTVFYKYAKEKAAE